MHTYIRKALYGLMLAGMLFSTSGAGSPDILHRSPSWGSQAARNGSSTGTGVQNQPAEAFRDFGVLSQADGWILVGQQLYWTTSNGASWSDITPALPAAGTIYSVKFLDSQTGWVLWSNHAVDGSLVLQLERTSDQGRHWNNSVIQAWTPDDPEADVANASMDWIDANTGWISVKQQTGSNFSVGMAFQTEDGGQTWQRRSLPIGDPVHFVNSQVGWMVGGPAGDQIFNTQDGGNTWQAQSLPGSITSSQRYSLYSPVFDSPENGLLPVVMLNGSDFELGLYSTGDAGQSWIPVSRFPLGLLVDWLPLSRQDAHNLAAALPNSDRIIHMINGEVKTIINQDGMSADIVALKMLDSNFGWAKWHTGTCTPQTDMRGSTTNPCSSTSQLIATRDGGITWQALDLPGNIPGALTQRYQTASTSQARAESVGVGKTLLEVGQGFDICTVPTLAQLQAWWIYSPYKSVNLYIGGVARYCANTILTADYVNQIRQLGWTVIPTWVGPQAPCTDYIHKFSWDVNTAFIQGKDEAYFATARLAELGLTYEDMSGSVVYYDLEAYGTDLTCREAVKAFVNGWVTHLHDFSNLAGVYGGTLCDTGLHNYLAIPNVPDAIWPARWYYYPEYPTFNYDPNASVWTVGTCIPTTVWNNHQRIRQYAGDHFETWGKVRLGTIDSDVLDGVVAIPYFGEPSADFSAVTQFKPALTVEFTILNTAFISSCLWDYGDGQTSNSCAYRHTHAYPNAGTYTVSLTVSSPWGTVNPTSSRTITVNYLVALPGVTR